MIWKTLEGYSKYTISENADIKNINSNKLVKGNIQEYEEDDYGNAYDPSQSLLLAL